MNKIKIPVINAKGEVVDYVSQSTTSIGAAKILKIQSAKFSTRHPITDERVGRGCWVPA